MTDTEILAIFQKEISKLKKTLEEIEPDWFVKSLENHSDNDDYVTTSVCAPIRAAIVLLRQNYE